MLFSGPHRTEEAGERSGHVSSLVSHLCLCCIVHSSMLPSCLCSLAIQIILKVLFSFQGSCQARVKRRPWRPWTTWPTWSSRTHPSTWSSSAWTKGTTGATRDPWIPWPSRERWTEGVWVSVCCRAWVCFCVSWVLKSFTALFMSLTPQGTKGDKGDPVSYVFLLSSSSLSVSVLYPHNNLTVFSSLGSERISRISRCGWRSWSQRREGKEGRKERS